MKRYVLIVLFLMQYFNVFAKRHASGKVYIATYGFQVRYDPTFINDQIKKNVSEGKTRFGYSNTDTSNYAKEAIMQMSKLAINGDEMNVNCNEKYNIITVHHASQYGDNKKKIGDNNVNMHAHVINKTMLFIDNLLYKEVRIRNDTLQPCQLIDTSYLSFKPTGKHKNVLDLDCEEYKPLDNKYNSLSLWVCKTLENYINPGIFAINVDGGVVEVDYGENKIVLEKLVKTNSTDRTPIPFCIVESNIPINVLDKGYGMIVIK